MLGNIVFLGEFYGAGAPGTLFRKKKPLRALTGATFMTGGDPPAARLFKCGVCGAGEEKKGGAKVACFSRRF